MSLSDHTVCRCYTRSSTASGCSSRRAVPPLSTTSCWSVGTRSDITENLRDLGDLNISFQDPMKRPTFETLQWKLEDFFTMSDSEYKEASQY